MSLQDPIADLFTRIRNGLKAKKKYVLCSYSKIKLEIIKKLLANKYIVNFSIIKDPKKAYLQTINIKLKYNNNIPVITCIKRVSKPSLQKYCKASKIPSILNGNGIYLLSTVHGILTDKEAIRLKSGGEIIGCVY